MFVFCFFPYILNAPTPKNLYIASTPPRTATPNHLITR